MLELNKTISDILVSMKGVNTPNGESVYADPKNSDNISRLI